MSGSVGCCGFLSSNPNPNKAFLNTTLVQLPRAERQRPPRARKQRDAEEDFDEWRLVIHTNRAPLQPVVTAIVWPLKLHCEYLRAAVAKGVDVVEPDPGCPFVPRRRFVEFVDGAAGDFKVEMAKVFGVADAAAIEAKPDCALANRCFDRPILAKRVWRDPDIRRFGGIAGTFEQHPQLDRTGGRVGGGAACRHRGGVAVPRSVARARLRVAAHGDAQTRTNAHKRARAHGLCCKHASYRRFTKMQLLRPAVHAV